MITAVMIGAGNRGIGAYGFYAAKNPLDLMFVAVADPDPVRRAYFAEMHKIEAKHCFSGFQELLAEPRLADACFVCTQDNMHLEPALTAMQQGYDVFLEKPMAADPKDCIRLGAAAKECRVELMIGHVLRYTPFFATIKHLLDSGRIGRLMSIQHNENVSYWHQAHSYVRGNWANSKRSSPMILAKSCHDLDLIAWFAKAKPVRISSFGSLSYFNAENAPLGAPAYCLDGCPVAATCPYHAKKVYLPAADWMKLPVSNDLSDGAILKAIEKGPYGRCVYRCDNDVVDHQVVAIEFEGGLTASFTMTAFTHENTRTIKLMGTHGELRGHLDKNIVEVYVFGENGDQPVEVIHTELSDAGHGGGDDGIMKAFVELVEKGLHRDVADVGQSVLAHLLAFAAETSRTTGKTVEYDAFVRALEA
ncbi:MAG: oxidoreductase [Tenericutes bacterium GWF2_57_13]|nr:MAG: oxidoreductase [Tenericutes bacterium GWF2_57_13]